MGELGWVGHDVDRLDSSMADVQGENGVRLPVEIAHDRRLPIDLDDALDPIPRHQLSETAHDAARDPLRSVQQVRDRDRLAAAVRMKDDVIGEQCEQPVHVAALRRLAKSLEQIIVFLRRRRESRTHRADVQVSAS